MKTTSIRCLLLLILVAIELSSFAQAAPPLPTLTCTIEQPLDAPHGIPLTYDVSNIGYLVMDVLINTQGGQLDGSGDVSINPPTNNLPASYLLITATNSSGTSVPVKASITADLSGTGGYGITFFLPDTTAIRTANEQAYINNAKATDSGSSATSKAWVNANNTQALAVIDRIYTQSQVGAFTITVTYVSTKSGMWHGTVAGTPIIVNVENKGDLLNNLPN
jgi:hypothetical protein